MPNYLMAAIKSLLCIPLRSTNLLKPDVIGIFQTNNYLHIIIYVRCQFLSQ